MIEVEERDGAIRFSVRVAPRASRDAVGGAHEGALRVRTTAAPVDGRANAAVAKLLAKALGVPRSAVRIVGGESRRSKRVEVAGGDPETVRGLA